ncbi:MAG: MgtC/SapB family protein [bacterium]|nr:MgtC/SapB family protein [bacterium]
MLPESEIIIRLLVAAGLGAAVGFERERSNKVAGLRTHSLVAIGSALISILSVYGFENVAKGPGYDPSRLISNIIVGIGFIGGGAILRYGPRVIGTTTAATLWLVAAVGIAAGLGFYGGALAATIIAYIILTVLWQIEKKFSHRISYPSLLLNNNEEKENKENMHELGE